MVITRENIDNIEIPTEKIGPADLEGGTLSSNIFSLVRTDPAELEGGTLSLNIFSLVRTYPAKLKGGTLSLYILSGKNRSC